MLSAVYAVVVCLSVRLSVHLQIMSRQPETVHPPRDTCASMNARRTDMIRDMTTDVVGMIPVTRVIVMIDVMTIAMIDDHHLIIMVIAQRLQIDVAKEDKIAPVVPAEQDMDSPGGTNRVVNQDPRIETPGAEEDLWVEVDHHDEVTRPPDRPLTVRMKFATNVVGRDMRTSTNAQQSTRIVALVESVATSRECVVRRSMSMLQYALNAFLWRGLHSSDVRC